MDVLMGAIILLKKGLLLLLLILKLIRATCAFKLYR